MVGAGRVGCIAKQWPAPQVTDRVSEAPVPAPDTSGQTIPAVSRPSRGTGCICVTARKQATRGAPLSAQEAGLPLARMTGLPRGPDVGRGGALSRGLQGVRPSPAAPGVGPAIHWACDLSKSCPSRIPRL